jgi:hypothetical protein
MWVHADITVLGGESRGAEHERVSAAWILAIQDLPRDDDAYRFYED